MKILLAIFFFLCNLICHVIIGADWCAFECHPGRLHIGCELKGECSTPADPCKFLEFDHSKMVAAHNKLRYKFAAGSEPKAPGIQVANMMAVAWDNDLAFLAGCNLIKCDSNMKHDQCRSTKDFKSAGQNIAWSSGVSDCVTQSYKFVQSWYNEVEYVTESQIKQLGENFQMIEKTGHFTQVVWASTSHIGCALWSKGSDSSTECMLTCNYGPAGNMLGGSMFKSGPPASACPEGIKPNNGLCGGSESGSISIYHTTTDLKIIAIVELLIVRQIYKLN